MVDLRLCTLLLLSSVACIGGSSRKGKKPPLRDPYPPVRDADVLVLPYNDLDNCKWKERTVDLSYDDKIDWWGFSLAQGGGATVAGGNFFDAVADASGTGLRPALALFRPNGAVITADVNPTNSNLAQVSVGRTTPPRPAYKSKKGGGRSPRVFAGQGGNVTGIFYLGVTAKGSGAVNFTTPFKAEGARSFSKRQDVKDFKVYLRYCGPDIA